ncbi:hypothetical protein [Pedobacter sp.]|uniref:hypothetical protein n=1 Tax=Pedobacter sp. TaxID=1411316 RepID=UPI003BAAF59D
MQLIIDLDGTICTEERTYSRAMAKPLPNAVDSINKLYEEGNTIIIYSARTWMEYEMTIDWLTKNDVKFHQLILGKPIGDVWIDDRAIGFDGWDNVNRILENKKSKK